MVEGTLGTEVGGLAGVVEVRSLECYLYRDNLVVCAVTRKLYVGKCFHSLGVDSYRVSTARATIAGTIGKVVCALNAFSVPYYGPRLHNILLFFLNVAHISLSSTSTFDVRCRNKAGGFLTDSDFLTSL